ncbi:Probable calcium-binding protein CML46 [Linum perenne]
MAFFQLYYLITPQVELFSTKHQYSSSSSSSSSSLLILFFDIILCKLIFDRIRSFPKIFSRFSFFLQSQLRLGGEVDFSASELEEVEKQLQSTTTIVMSREDVEVVMGKVGFFFNPESQNHIQSMGNGKILELFDKEEPSLGEIKEAFDVFDVNRDGFIDEEAELQRVMFQLGLKEEVEIDSCRKMIKAFDENGDGRIVFSEFIKFMEKSFC